MEFLLLYHGINPNVFFENSFNLNNLYRGKRSYAIFMIVPTKIKNKMIGNFEQKQLKRLGQNPCKVLKICWDFGQSLSYGITNSKFAQPILGLQEGKILVRAQQYLNFNFYLF